MGSLFCCNICSYVELCTACSLSRSKFLILGLQQDWSVPFLPSIRWSETKYVPSHASANQITKGEE